MDKDLYHSQTQTSLLKNVAIRLSLPAAHVMIKHQDGDPICRATGEDDDWRRFPRASERYFPHDRGGFYDAIFIFKPFIN